MNAFQLPCIHKGFLNYTTRQNRYPIYVFSFQCHFHRTMIGTEYVSMNLRTL